jgi:glycosyltransferase involved in cell wall biosynthesis
VLHVITRFMDGSGGNTLLTAAGMDPVLYDVWIVSSPAGPLWARAAQHGLRTVKLPRFREVLSPFDDLVVFCQLFRLIHGERFTIVHTHSSKAGFLGRLAAWLARTPVIVHTIHGFSWHDFMSRRRRLAYVTLERLAGRITDAFVAVAPQVAREAVETGMTSCDRVAVIFSAVELDEIPDDRELVLREPLGVPPDELLVGTIGRVDFQKAPGDFLAMATIVARSHPAARFVWVGGGTLLEEMRRRADAAEAQIDFVGFRDDAARLAAAFDIYVVSSLYEGLGRGVTEAMASARPVAATAVNGVVDVVEQDVTGLLSAPADPEALAQNVLRLIEEPEAARRMGLEGRLRVRRLFHPALMTREIHELYARLLGFPATSRASKEWGAE